MATDAQHVAATLDDMVRTETGTGSGPHAPLRGRVLVVCTMAETSDRIERVAGRVGLTTVFAADGETALYLAGVHLLDAVVVASALPGIDVPELCREIRRRGRTAVLVVSAGGAVSRLAALDAGADDHIDLPFHPDELAARLRAVVRRTAGPLAAERTVRLGPVAVRVARGAGRMEGVDQDATAEDATVLGTLAERCGCVVTRAALRERLAARHGRDAAERLDECIARVSAVLAAAGAPAVEAVQGGGGFVLRP